MKDKKTLNLKLETVKQEPVFESVNQSPSVTYHTFEPATNIYETDSDYIFVIEMLGTDENGVRLKKYGRTLYIENNPELFDIPVNAREIQKEFVPVLFKKVIELPNDADPENINMKMKNGILYLTVKKTNENMLN